MNIDLVYINTHRYDHALTRICIASIRYWYPEIPIRLIIDHSNGDMNTDRLAKKWNITVLDTGKKEYGWGFGKFEPLFLNNTERFLVLDADTVMVGPVLDKLANLDGDFIVDKEEQSEEKLVMLYYDPKEARQIYPGFVYPGYTFNTGQWAGTGNVLTKADFDDLVTWQPSPRLKYPAAFKQADQGIFNLLLHRKEQEGRISLARVPLMIWPEDGAANFIQLTSIKSREGDFPFIIHWAGMKFKSISDYPRGDIMQFYKDFYYSGYSLFGKMADKWYEAYLNLEKKLRLKWRKIKSTNSK